MTDDTLYLIHIAERARRIGEFAQPGKAEFLRSLLVQDAIQHNLEIIGEATKNLHPATRADHPELRWKEMAGLRDVLIHACPRVELERIWSICTTEIPRVRETVDRILIERGVDPDRST